MVATKKIKLNSEKLPKLKFRRVSTSLECKQRIAKKDISSNDPCFWLWYAQILKFFSKNLSRELKMILWIIQLTTTTFQVCIWTQIFDPLLDIFFIHFVGSDNQTLINISDLVAAIQDSQKKNQDPFNPAKEILF